MQRSAADREIRQNQGLVKKTMEFI